MTGKPSERFVWAVDIGRITAIDRSQKMIAMASVETVSTSRAAGRR